MEKINGANSPEDIEKVEKVIEETKAALASMGNNNNEGDKIEETRKSFFDGKIDAETAINKLRYMPWQKQEGAM